MPVYICVCVFLMVISLSNSAPFFYLSIYHILSIIYHNLFFIFLPLSHPQSLPYLSYLLHLSCFLNILTFYSKHYWFNCFSCLYHNFSLNHLFYYCDDNLTQQYMRFKIQESTKYFWKNQPLIHIVITRELWVRSSAIYLQPCATCNLRFVNH